MDLRNRTPWVSSGLKEKQKVGAGQRSVHPIIDRREGFQLNGNVPDVECRDGFGLLKSGLGGGFALAPNIFHHSLKCRPIA